MCAFLQALLYFIYWDTLPDVEKLFGLNSKCASTLMAQHLLAAADRYALERLRLLCEAVLCENVAINTVAKTLALAEQHQCPQLKAVCLKYIALPENLEGRLSCTFDLHVKAYFRNREQLFMFLIYQAAIVGYISFSRARVVTKILVHSFQL